jgi:DNA-binding transcriptional ArsR family regulator
MVHRSRVRTLRLQAKQARVLASPARLEIVAAIAVLGPSAVGEIAVHLRRSFGSVFHHVQALARAGLLKEVGRRPGPRRPETLYRVVAPRLAIAGTSAGPSGAIALRALLAILRQAGRDARACLENPSRRVRGQFNAAQLNAALLPAEVLRIHRLLSEIEAVLRTANRQRRRRAPIYRWTTVFAPLFRRKGGKR